MRSRWEGESEETEGEKADRGMGGRINYSCNMVRGWTEKLKLVQEKAMKKCRHGKEAY